MAIILAVYVVFLALCLWAMVCNQKCYKQQIALIDAIYKANKARGYANSYWHLTEVVSYDRHLWRLFTLRDPWAIYPPELAEVWALA